MPIARFAGKGVDAVAYLIALLRVVMDNSAVAPFTGAWIETLKSMSMVPSVYVAPFTGAWIETTYRRSDMARILSRTLHGCVD